MVPLITNTDYLEAIRKCDLFSELDESEYAEAIQFLDGKIKKYRKGDIVLMLGEKFTKAGILLKGTIESSFQNEKFDQVSMRRFSAGTLFGEALVCNGTKESPVQVTSIDETVVLFVDLNKIYSCHEGTALQFKLAENLIKSLAKKNLYLNQKVRILSQKSLRDRILIYLSTLKKDNNGYMTIPFSQTALAEHLDVNRSALSRELGRMQNDGVIVIKDNGYKLL